MTVSIRVSTDADAQGLVDLRRDLYPYAVISATSLLHTWKVDPPAAKVFRLAAEEDGRLVAYGRAAFNTWSSIEGAANLGMLVSKAYRGQGIGSRFYDALMDHLVSNGVTRVEGWGEGNDVVAAFLGRRGFERRNELRYSHLDLRQPLPPMPDLPDGVRVVSFAQSSLEDLFAIDVESIQDEPGDTPADNVDFEEYRAQVWDAPETDHQASTVVYADGQPAAYTLVETDGETGRMWSGGTGSLRAFRGRGLAKIAKSAALRRAAERGITDAYTTNDEVNKPMLAINVWLGYKPCDVQWSYLKTL
jgi:GNAT superfamily N-acetyltransferase